jgi:DNA polymerase elongation subunit (family B)
MLPVENEIQKLIYGRDRTERITNIEVKGDGSQLEIFIEDREGKVSSQSLQNQFWVLTPKPARNSIPLNGNLHYKHALLFDTKEEFYQAARHFASKDSYIVWNAKEQAMLKSGLTYHKGMKANEPSILSFDIETTSLNPKDPKANVLIIANTFRRQGKITRKLFAYNEFNSDLANAQKPMIEAWTAWVREMNPSILLGYNINSFDFPYLETVARREGTSLQLGRDDSDLWFNKNDSKFRKDGSQFYTYKKVNVYGREVIDGFFVALRYDVGRKYESYKLKQLIKQEGLEVPGRVFYDGEQIRFKYHIPEEFEKIKQYAQFDGDDALNLYDLMIPAVFYFTQSIPKPFQLMTESASGSQLNSLLVRSYLQNKHSIPKADESAEFEGAISHGIPGVHKNVLSFDVASLYPSVMLEYKIYPKHKDPNQHVLKVLEYFTNERLKNKKLAKETGEKYYKDLQESQKVGINSMYGFLGTPGLNFNFPQGASEVTRRGREVLGTAIKWATGKTYEEWKPKEEASRESEDL